MPMAAPDLCDQILDTHTPVDPAQRPPCLPHDRGAAASCPHLLAEDKVQQGETLRPGFGRREHLRPALDQPTSHIRQVDHSIRQLVHRHAQQEGSSGRSQTYLNAALQAFVPRVQGALVQTYDERGETGQRARTRMLLRQERITQAQYQDHVRSRCLPTITWHRRQLVVTAISQDCTGKQFPWGALNPHPSQRRVVYTQQHPATL